MTVLSLKTLCKERGLRVSGNKAEVIIRLMENDEAGGAPQSLVVQPMQMQQSPQIIQLVSSNADDKSVATTFGIFIMLYGLFRIGMSMFFTTIDEEVFLFESVLAWLIGMTFILSGVFTMLGYRNGIFMAVVTLLISGMLSLIYHDEWSPLSIGLDGTLPMIYSMMCSGLCLLIVAIPLMVGGNQFRAGWPEAIQNIIEGIGSSGAKSAASSDKVTIECPNCDVNIRIPSDYTGDSRCPSCKKVFTID